MKTATSNAPREADYLKSWASFFVCNGRGNSAGAAYRYGTKKHAIE